MIDPDVARKWMEKEVDKQQEIDSPNRTSTRRSSSTSLPPKKKNKQQLDEKSEDNSDPEDSPPVHGTPSTISATPSKHARHSLGSAHKEPLDPGILALVLHSVCEATYDIVLNGERARPYMYWNGSKTTACAKMLIKRTPALRLLAEKYRRNEFTRNYVREKNQTSSE